MDGINDDQQRQAANYSRQDCPLPMRLVRERTKADVAVVIAVASTAVEQAQRPPQHEHDQPGTVDELNRSQRRVVEIPVSDGSVGFEPGADEGDD